MIPNMTRYLLVAALFFAESPQVFAGDSKRLMRTARKTLELDPRGNTLANADAIKPAGSPESMTQVETTHDEDGDDEGEAIIFDPDGDDEGDPDGDDEDGDAEDAEDAEDADDEDDTYYLQPAKGTVTLESLSASPCKVAGDLKYNGMQLSFDFHDKGMSLAEEDGTVIFFAVEEKGTDSIAVTIENENFVNQKNADGTVSLLHMGTHQEHFHKHDAESIKSAVLAANAEQLQASHTLWAAKEKELYKDKYDNAVLELLPAIATHNISGISHNCVLNLRALYNKIQEKSEVVDEETKGEVSKVTTSPKEDDDLQESLMSTDSDAESGRRRRRRRRWWSSRRRSRRRHRCPYNHCGNSQFGRCGDGYGFGCIWVWCYNCDCNLCCETHDHKCHCTSGGCPLHNYGIVSLFGGCRKCRHQGCR